MAEYIERDAAVAVCCGQYKKCLRKSDMCSDTVAWNICFEIKQLPAADVIPTPLKYAAMTNIHDGEEYTLDLSIPITQKQFDAIANGTDIWEVLKNG